MAARREVEVYADLAALSRAAADAVAGAAGAAVAARGRFTIALSGGHTPRALYELLGTAYLDRVPWAATSVFFGDERCVPPDDSDSNYRMAREALIDRVPGLASRTHRIEGERPAAAAAERYEATVRATFGERAEATFDVALLGLGTDGHTASLFPGSPVLDEQARWAVAATAPPGAPVRDRVTLTFPALNAARTTLLMAAGADKREVVAHILESGSDARAHYPAARVMARERLVWMLDAAASPEPAVIGAG